MKNKELTCICCPMGCALNIEIENIILRDLVFKSERNDT